MSLRLFTRRTALVGVALSLCRPTPGEAHAILEASDPADGAVVPSGPTTLRLRYNSRVDRTRSLLTLTAPDGGKTAVPIDRDGPPNIMTARVTLVPGAYVLHWQVLAIDGHITRGDVAFTAKGP